MIHILFDAWSKEPPCSHQNAAIFLFPMLSPHLPSTPGLLEGSMARWKCGASGQSNKIPVPVVIKQRNALLLYIVYRHLNLKGPGETVVVLNSSAAAYLCVATRVGNRCTRRLETSRLGIWGTHTPPESLASAHRKPMLLRPNWQ